MPQIVIKITPSAGVTSVTVHIDGTDVTNQTSPITSSSGNHKLHWWFAGPAGETLDIVISPSPTGAAILKVSDSIAPGYIVEAGDKTFTL